jgi:hypothetical protein
MSSALVKHGNGKTERAIPKASADGGPDLIPATKGRLEAAAKEAGIRSTQSLRQYLKRPEAQRHFREQHRLLVEAVAAGNPIALKDVRDSSANPLARVNAVRLLELMTQEVDQTGYSRHTPGAPDVTIVVVGSDARSTRRP